jgi:hypothetical protein
VVIIQYTLILWYNLYYVLYVVIIQYTVILWYNLCYVLYVVIILIQYYINIFHY